MNNNTGGILFKILSTFWDKFLGRKVYHVRSANILGAALVSFRFPK